MKIRKNRTLPAEMTAQQRDLYQEIALGPRAAESAFPLTEENGALTGPFDAMLLAPALGSALQRLGAALRFSGSLTDRAREIAILLVAHHHRSEFEIHAHEAVGRRVGLSENDLADLAEGRAPRGADFYEASVAEVVNELLREKSLADETYHTAVRRLGAELIFEINTLVGYYALLAVQIEIFDPRSPDN